MELKVGAGYYRSLIENTSDIIVVVGSDGAVRYVSPSIERLLGHTPEEAMKDKEFHGVHPDDRALIGGAIAKAMETPGAIGPTIELRCHHKDGSWRYMEATGKAVRDESDHVLAIVSMRDISERKLAEQALRESEERLSRVVSAARDAIIMIDAKGNVSLWNDSAVQIFGYSADQVLGKNLHRLIAPARFRDRCQKGLSLFSDSGDGPAVGHVTELTALREDGTEFPVEISLSPVRVNTEWHAVGIVRDITGRKQIEEALKKSEATLRSVFSAAPVGIAITNSNRVPEWMNEGMTSITGYTTEELACRGARLFYASEEKFTHVGKAILDGIQESGIGMTDTKWIQKNGEIRDIHLRGAAIDPNDIPAGLVFMAVDITERKRTEEALEESEAKYRSVVETSLAGVYILQDNLIRFVNRRWCDIFGYRYEEVVDKSGPLDIVHPEDKEMVREKIGQRLTGKFNSSGYEFRALRKDGQVITVRALGRFMVYRGRPAVTGALTDITREKVLESQLLQSQKMEAVGTLAGGIAHDFNNILTVIMGYAAMLQIKMDSADPSRILVGQILSASQKAAGLTHGLLAFSRQQPVSLKPVHINDIVKGTEGLLRRLLSEDIVLTTSLCKEDITIMADPTQIDQILFNLATNARDAMPGGGDLSIETKLLEIDDGFVGMHGPVEPGRYVLLSVSDTGTGMDEKTKDKIFEPFFTTKELGRGTGLGLSTVYGIVKQHDGHVTVYSEQNTGTTFHVYLPAISVAAPEEKSVAQEIRGGTESILLAEDNDDVRRLMKNILAGYGYSVIEAVDGEDAVRKFSSSEKIDLVILDSVMPRMNGRAAYDEISRNNSPIKVLFTSGYTKDIVLRKGIEDKRFDFVSKPLAPRDLLKKVREVLDK